MFLPYSLFFALYNMTHTRDTKYIAEVVPKEERRYS
ncbi:hypothetical protein AAZX31_13G277800 [Glycine max]